MSMKKIKQKQRKKKLQSISFVSKLSLSSAFWLKPFLLEFIFIACYFLVDNNYDFHLAHDMPVWLAYLFLLVVLLDNFAIYYKLEAVRYNESLSRAVLPDNIIMWLIFFIMRLAVFSTIISNIAPTITGSVLTTFGYVILWILLLSKELFVFSLMMTKGNSSRRQKPDDFLVFLADITIILSAQFALIMIETNMLPVFDIAKPFDVFINLILYGITFI